MAMLKEGTDWWLWLDHIVVSMVVLTVSRNIDNEMHQLYEDH